MLMNEINRYESKLIYQIKLIYIKKKKKGKKKPNKSWKFSKVGKMVLILYIYFITRRGSWTIRTVKKKISQAEEYKK